MIITTACKYYELRLGDLHYMTYFNLNGQDSTKFIELLETEKCIIIKSTAEQLLPKLNKLINNVNITESKFGIFYNNLFFENCYIDYYGFIADSKKAIIEEDLKIKYENYVRA